MTPSWLIGRREDSLWEPSLLPCTPIGHLGVIYDSQPGRWKHLHFDWKIVLKNYFFIYKPLTRYSILRHSVSTSRVKKIFLLQAILSCISSKSRESYVPTLIQIRVKISSVPIYVVVKQNYFCKSLYSKYKNITCSTKDSFCPSKCGNKSLFPHTEAPSQWH
jgi:hypothetical protein